jgi:hypothetical protein
MGRDTVFGGSVSAPSGREESPVRVSGFAQRQLFKKKGGHPMPFTDVV